MVLAVGLTLLGQLYFIRAVKMIDFTERFLVHEITSICSLICGISVMEEATFCVVPTNAPWRSTPGQEIFGSNFKVGSHQTRMVRHAMAMPHHLISNHSTDVDEAAELSNWETAVNIWAGAKGLTNKTLLGTPIEAHSLPAAPVI